MKVATWNGCRDCPYFSPEDFYGGNFCKHGKFHLSKPIPETPHPDCKLPDLPTQEDVKHFAENQNYILGRTESIEKGANYILNAIKK